MRKRSSRYSISVQTIISSLSLPSFGTLFFVRLPHSYKSEKRMVFPQKYARMGRIRMGKNEKQKKKVADKPMAWELVGPLLRKYVLRDLWILIPAVFAGAVAASAGGFGLPYIIRTAFPIVFGEQELPPAVEEWARGIFQPENMRLVKLWLAALVIPLLMILRGVGTYVNSYLLVIVGTRMLKRMWRDVFARIQSLSFSFFDSHKRGELMTVIIQFTQNIQGQMVTIMNDLVIQPLTLVFAAGYLVYSSLTNRESAIFLGNLVAVAMVVPLVRFVGRQMVRRMQQALAGAQQITAVVEETLSAQREVRAFNMEENRTNELSRLISFYNIRILRMAAWSLSLPSMVEILSAFALSYSLYQGCGGGLTMEQFASIATAFYFCYDPVKRIGSVINQAQITTTMIDGLNRILYAKDETPEPAQPKPLPSPVRGEVDFDHVNFAYLKGKPVLHDVQVHVPAGQIVALVGPSGSGKTTFINLICRFYDVSSGAVRIDGVDVRDIASKDLIAQIGLVSQFSALFHDSIMENIRIGRPDASDAEVMSAGASARVSEFAEEMPKGYRYELSESGGGLSGGQRQRVSIARAFLKNAPILILDEATSALDMKSEALIQESLEELARGHTTFIIAHRFSTIRMAQRILVFEEGRIIADGSHAELYAQCALYRSLYDEQVRSATERGKEGTP